MKKVIASVLASSILAGCATPPNQMMAQRISPQPYSDYTCSQLDLGYSDKVVRHDELEKELQSLAQNDAMQMTAGMLLLWPALFLLEGGDGPEADEYTRIKGEMNALESVAIEKECSEFSVEKIEPIQPIKPINKTQRCGMYQMCNEAEGMNATRG